MILDTGICTVYSETNTATAGRMPVYTATLKYQSWYGELDFATTPSVNSGLGEDVEIAARVRIVQNRSISPHDVVALAHSLTPTADDIKYKIIRAFHGTDEDNGQPITDLTLEKVVQQYVLG